MRVAPCLQSAVFRPWDPGPYDESCTAISVQPSPSKLWGMHKRAVARTQCNDLMLDRLQRSCAYLHTHVHTRARTHARTHKLSQSLSAQDAFSIHASLQISRSPSTITWGEQPLQLRRPQDTGLQLWGRAEAHNSMPLIDGTKVKCRGEGGFAIPATPVNPATALHPGIPRHAGPCGTALKQLPPWAPHPPVHGQSHSRSTPRRSGLLWALGLLTRRRRKLRGHGVSPLGGERGDPAPCGP